MTPDHPPSAARRWAWRGSLLLLLGPFLLLAGVSGERAARDAEWISEKNDALFDADAELVRGQDRLIVYSTSAPEVRVFSLDGRRIGRVRASPNAPTEGPPFRDGEWVLYLQRRATLREAHVARIPVRGDGYTRRFRLPGDVPIQVLDENRSEVLTPWPFALRCGGEILLRLERGWARLALGPGIRYRRGVVPPLAPRLEGPPARECQALRPVEAGQPIPIEHALYDEVWQARTPYLLGSPRLPPPYLVMVGPDRKRVRLFRPPIESAVPGSVFRSGRYLLFQGRACDLGELRLTLSDLEDPGGRASRWSVVVPISREDCRPGTFDTQLCASGAEQVVRVLASDQVLVRRVSDGGAADPAPTSRCTSFRELRRGVASWEAARTLDVDTWRYRVDPGASGDLILSARELSATEPRWRVPVGAEAYPLGATGDALLLVAGEVLEVRERSTGAVRSRQPLEALRLVPGAASPVCRFIGSVGRRAFFLVQSQATWLVFFDGVRARIIR